MATCLLIIFIIPGVLQPLLYADEPITPIPTEFSYDARKARLGKALFSDTVLSKDSTVSCASCHNFKEGGADSRHVSLGVDDQDGNIQSPTVFNARFNFRQFWNGRAADLYAQAKEPMHNPKEMYISNEEIERRINESPSYRDGFRTVYGTKTISYAQVIDAIVEFEKALVTPNSRFDRFLRNESELTPLEANGYRRFKELGCITCHNGVNVGGNSYQRMGTIIPYRHDTTYPDLYAHMKQERYKNVFKVPTLRNVALTAPYFHDASAKTLSDAVKFMGYYNLGIVVKPRDIEAIVAFLQSLTGEIPAILAAE